LLDWSVNTQDSSDSRHAHSVVTAQFGGRFGGLGQPSER
jgi:hypothetical protein